MADDRYPRAYSVGGLVDTGRYADPFYDTAGRNRTPSGGTARTDLQSSIVYVQGQQAVYRPDRSDRGATLFGGVFWRGPLGARPQDTVGVAVSYTAVDSRITERIDGVL